MVIQNKTILIIIFLFGILAIPIAMNSASADVGSLTYEFGFRDASTSGLASLTSDDNGYVYLAYSNTAEIEKWSTNGTFVESFPTEYKSLDLTSDSNGNLYAQHNLVGNIYIYVYDSSGNNIFSFPINLQGNDAFDKLNNILYHSVRSTSTVYAYNSSGALINALPIGFSLTKDMSIDNSNIYQVDAHGNVTKHNSSGSLLDQWNIPLVGVTYNNLYGNDDKIYVGIMDDQDDGYIATFDIDTNDIELTSLPNPSAGSIGTINQIGDYLYVSADDRVPNVLVYSIELAIPLFCNQPESYYNVIHGTESSDYIFGTRNADLIFGYGGNDFIRGMGGDDCIYGGSGNDFIQGEAGNDVIYAGNGDDTVRTGNGNDLIFGEDGNDILFAVGRTGGANLLDGGNGTDICVPSMQDITTTTINCEITE